MIRRQNAQAVAEVAQKKKAGENKTFELMESDLEAYAVRHLETAQAGQTHLSFWELRETESVIQ